MDRKILFIDGVRVFKPHQNAPDYVIANGEINIAELQSWLAKQEGEKIRMDIMESKNGSYYAKVNNFTPDPSKGSTAKNNQPPPDFGPPPSDDFEDDVPF